MRYPLIALHRADFDFRFQHFGDHGDTVLYPDRVTEQQHNSVIAVNDFLLVLNYYYIQDIRKSGLEIAPFSFSAVAEKLLKPC